MAENGEVIQFDARQVPKIVGRATAGALLVDQTGNIVPELVTKDHLLLQGDGFLVVIVTINKRTGRLMTSPDIITRGVFSIQDNADLMDTLRRKIQQLGGSRGSSRAATDVLKQTIKDITVEYMYVQTGKLPIVIPVVNVVGSHSQSNTLPKPVADTYV